MAKLEVKLHLADRNVLTLTCTDCGVFGMIRMLRQSRIVRTEVNAVSPPEPVPDKVESFTVGERRMLPHRRGLGRPLGGPDRRWGWADRRGMQ